MKNLLVVITVILAVVVQAAPKMNVSVVDGVQSKAKSRINHIPENADGLDAFIELAKNTRHVELVNVAGAVDAQEWDVITRFVARAMPLNYWTNSLAKSPTMDLVSGKIVRHESLLGEKAKVAVFVEKDGSGRPAFLSSAGRWASVDITNAVKSSPDAQTRKDRIAKYLMKAIAYAIGGGASTDRNSPLGGAIVCIEQLDKTPIICPPMSFFPLVEAIDALTGGEGSSRPSPEDE